VDVIVDSSLWIDGLAGETIPEIEQAMEEGTMVLSALVIAELLSGQITLEQRGAIGELLQDFPMHDTDLGHWMRVGGLRRLLAMNGVNVTIPDAHVAQCALDRDATLYSRDEIFPLIARHTSLRLSHLR
jgi:predicted nucleic acid-binding protein